MIRKATSKDIDAAEEIYSAIHTEEEQGHACIGWNRSIYPTRETTEKALAAGDLFVIKEEGKIVATTIINQKQVPCYGQAQWKHKAEDNKVMVHHTLTVDPASAKKGYGKAFVDFYEEYALANSCHFLRMDTNEKNTRARQMYARLGYEEVGIVPTVFNGIKGVNLVCLEKKI